MAGQRFRKNLQDVVDVLGAANKAMELEGSKMEILMILYFCIHLSTFGAVLNPDSKYVT